MARIPIRGLLALAFLAPVSAGAEVDIAALDRCVEDRVAENRPAAECVQQAHAACGAYPLETAREAAVLCYVEAQDGWSAAMRARLDRLEDTAEPRIAKLAGIEVKYDVLASLLQCDRMEELAGMTASEPDDGAIGLQKARCTATALGLAYTKLLLQSRSLQ